MKLEQLWKMYAETRLPETRNAIVERNMALVYEVAKGYVAIHGERPCIELHDLVQAGAIGLIQAVERFDQQRGTQFGTFARIRVLGAICGMVRKTTHNRRQHQRTQVDMEMWRVEDAPAGNPEDDIIDVCHGLSDKQTQVVVLRYVHGMNYAEIAKKMGMSVNAVSETLKECHKWVKDHAEAE
jgi:RNA polymerase sigma factor (sigma-70 family)